MLVFRRMTQGNIYFDFNAAIVTNTVTTTFVEELGINDDNSIGLAIYPNPTMGQLNVRADSMINKLSLYGLDGSQRLNKEVRTQTMLLNLAGLQSGIYFMKVELENGKSATRKVVVY